jgi:diaminohydroxyphosphoribosylaminopyrimidine deaminase/5-amino-6-(5-phosphoribosylamino)uracil reductase
VDDGAMAQAVAEGETARRLAPPNPWVGCVVVRDGEVVGRGASQPAGGAHAEVVALRQAGERARGATAYVTLAPCHHHGRTPPCTAALLEAGVARVVVALDDPDPVSGDGLAALRDAGVEVEVGVGREAAEASLRPYLRHRATGRPFTVVKTATSLDGRTAAADGSSRWITGPEARADAHGLRADSQAVVVGSQTALSDRPALTVRDAEGPAPAAPPLRVLLDARGRVPAEGPLFDTALAPTLVVTTGGADPEAVAAWKAAGAEVEEVPAAEPGVDVAAALSLLGRRGVLQALVEGGAALHGALLAAGVVDRVVQYVGGAVLGDAGRPAFAGVGVPAVEATPRFRLAAVRPVGGDVRLDWEPAA